MGPQLRHQTQAARVGGPSRVDALWTVVVATGVSLVAEVGNERGPPQGNPKLHRMSTRGPCAGRGPPYSDRATSTSDLPLSHVTFLAAPLPFPEPLLPVPRP